MAPDADDRRGAGRLGRLGAALGASSRPMDQRERLAVFAGAVLAAVAALAMWLPQVGKQSAAVPAAVIGVALGVVLFLTARRGGRLGAAMAAGLCAFGPWTRFVMVSYAFLALSGWLLFRNAKVLREERAAAGLPARPTRSRRRRNEPETPAGRKKPPPSKRYTPPRSRA
ncbi:MAG TPA: hypothetical protein VFP54_00245 [Acidimicrobiales bacterium]|nr:hypothetical protein [Acidimicrobiales bacterium]